MLCGAPHDVGGDGELSDVGFGNKAGTVYILEAVVVNTRVELGGDGWL